MTPASPTLLLADDSATTRRVVELTFADQGLRVVSVGDGMQAIERAEHDPPDIVLADIGMPGRDGYEVADFVRGHPRLSHVPVLLMAGAFEPADDSRVAACGAVGVLIKPLEPDTVINRVKELLRRGPGPAPAPGGRLVTPAAPEPVAAPAPPPAPAQAASAPVAVNDVVADAFAALLAAEQGGSPAAPVAEPEPGSVPEPMPSPAVPDAAAATIDADAVAAEVTARVTEQLVGGVGGDMVRAVAAEVAERVAREVAEQVTREVVAAVAERVTRELAAGVAEQVVRDEIARIRAAAADRR